MKKFYLLLALIVNSLLFSQTLTEKQMVNARATGYAIIAAKNPGVSFSVFVKAWDGSSSLEQIANTINPSWHAQAAIKGNYFNQAFDGTDFSGYSSVVTSQKEFDQYKSTGTQWWVVCSTLPSFSKDYSKTTAWSKEGNSGTNPATNFIGTTDSQDLIFKTNNLESMRITSGGKVKIGTNDPVTNPTSNLRIYGDSNPFIELANPLGRMTINKSSCNGCFASGAIAGDAVLRNLGQSHNMIFYMPNNLNNGTTYIGVGDDANAIWAKFYNDKTFRLNGRMSIGNANFACSDCSEYSLFVKNGIRAEKVKVDIASQNGWADYVFKKDYSLKSLEEVEKHINEKGHLPNIPSAKEVVEKGINVAEMDAKLLEKIEELTLYSIEQNKQIKKLQEENSKLKKQTEKIENLERVLLELTSKKQ